MDVNSYRHDSGIDGGGFSDDVLLPSELDAGNLHQNSAAQHPPYPTQPARGAAAGPEPACDRDTLDMERDRSFAQPLQQSDWDMFNLLYNNPGGNIQTPLPFGSVEESREGGFAGKGASGGSNDQCRQSFAAQQQVSFAFKSNTILTGNSGPAVTHDTEGCNHCEPHRPNVIKIAVKHKGLLCFLQEHFESVEEQLANTMAELAQLRLREQQLQAKNQLLEKVAHLDSRQRRLHASSMVGI